MWIPRGRVVSKWYPGCALMGLLLEHRDRPSQPLLKLNIRAAAAAKSLQSCPALCDPIDGSPPGSSVPGILQARTLESVAISFSNAWSEKWKWGLLVVSDSLRPHGLKPSRLLHPQNFPGKSTGVGCHFLLQCMKWKVKVKMLSHVQLLATPWTATYQAPPSMRLSRQEYWSGLPLPSPCSAHPP